MGTRYRGLPQRILWGTSNITDVAYALDNAKAYSKPRPGSEWGQTHSGVEDAWLLGEDHYLDGDWRWIPREDSLTPERRRASGWDGPAGVRAMLAWLRAKNVGRLHLDGRNLLSDYGELSVDSNGDGVADGFTVQTESGVTATRSMVAGFQRIQLTGGTSANTNAFVYRDYYGFFPGQTVTFSVECAIGGVVGNLQGGILIRWYDAGGTIVGAPSKYDLATTSYGRRAFASLVSPANAVRARVHLAARAVTAGTTGWADFRSAQIENGVTDGQVYYPPTLRSFYLAEPMETAAESEDDFTRRMRTSMRSADGLPWEGF